MRALALPEKLIEHELSKEKQDSSFAFYYYLCYNTLKNLGIDMLYLGKIDYSWNKPQTYLVLVPGLSLLIEKIKSTNLKPFINNDWNNKSVAPNEKSKEFANMCKWHLRGSLIQMACIGAITVYALPLFSLLSLLPICEALYTYSIAMSNPVVIHEYSPSTGQVIRSNGVRMPSIF